LHFFSETYFVFSHPSSLQVRTLMISEQQQEQLAVLRYQHLPDKGCNTQAEQELYRSQ
jgi:hypothetical protein